MDLKPLDISKFVPRETYTIINEEANKAMIDTLTSGEKQKLEEFVDRLKGDYPHDVKDTCTLVRFLKARNFDLEKSEKMYRARMKWVETFQPHKITEKDVMDDIQTGKCFFYGRDKQGRPVVVYRAARHFPNWKDINVALKFHILIVEIGIQLVEKAPNHKITAIYDRRGFSNSNVDMKLFAKTLTLADYYPEIINTIHIVGANWLFHTLYKVASSLIDPVTLKKINILPSDVKTALKELQKDVDPSNLLPYFGGNNGFKGFYLPSSTPANLVFDLPVGSENVTPSSPEDSDSETLYAKQLKDAQTELTQDPSVNVEELDLD